MKILFNPTSYRRGAVWAVGATAVWKVLSFLNALLIAAYFGAGKATDLYFYLILAMGLGVYFLQRMNAAVIIPEAMTRDAQTPGQARPLLNFFLYFYVALLILLTVAAWFFPVTLGRIFSRFPQADLTAQRSLLTLGFILFGLQLLASYLQSVLEMYHRFTSALFTPLNALLPLVCLVMLGGKCGIASMFYGFIASYLLQSIVFAGWIKYGLNWEFRWQGFYAGKQFLHNLGSNQLMELANLVSSVLPLYLLSGLSAGLVSALNYAKQLSDSTNEVLTLRVVNLSKIQITEDMAASRWDACNRHYLMTHYVLWFLLSPLVVFSFYYAQDIITLFFARGAFTQRDALEAAAFLRPLLLILLILPSVLMQNNMAAAGRKVKEFLPYGLFSTGLFIVLVPLAIWLWGAFAFPYMQLVCYLAGLAVSAVFLHKYFPAFVLKESYRQALHVVSINLIALVPAGVCGALTAGLHVWWRIGSAGILFVGFLMLITWKSGDLKMFYTFLRQQN
ncbi:MAG: hypothetical protein IKO35_04210 [Elusimicrobiaceae bacterium]|nr:hypothetical protein [Elusimicrobiaceae bacterium]